jgi:hypothetical protein
VTRKRRLPNRKQIRVDWQGAGGNFQAALGSYQASCTLVKGLWLAVVEPELLWCAGLVDAEEARNVAEVVLRLAYEKDLLELALRSL